MNRPLAVEGIRAVDDLGFVEEINDRLDALAAGIADPVQLIDVDKVNEERREIGADIEICPPQFFGQAFFSQSVKQCPERVLIGDRGCHRHLPSTRVMYSYRDYLQDCNGPTKNVRSQFLGPCSTPYSEEGSVTRGYPPHQQLYVL